MSQTDMNVANNTGAGSRADWNAHLDAIATNNSGSSFPSTSFANQWYANDSDSILYQRNSSNTVWIAKFQLTHSEIVEPGFLDVASSASVDIGAQLGRLIRITGTTTITSFGSITEGTIRKVRFADVLALTHNATSLILPGGSNIVTAANDTMELASLGSGNWLCLNYKRASGLPVSIGSLTSNPSLLGNGGMPVWQRGTTFLAADGYAADRWGYADGGGIGIVTISRDTDVPTITQAGFKLSYSLKVDVTTARPSITTGDYYYVHTSVEGFDTVQLGFGSSGAQAVALSVWVKSPKTGIHYCSIRNAAGDRSYPASFTVSSANTWEYKEIPITGDTAGTWIGATNGVGLRLQVVLAAGSTYHGTANTWNSADAISGSDQVNCMDSAANNFFMTAAKLEPGTSASTFGIDPFDVELRRSLRYYQKTFPYDTDPATGAGIVGMIVFRPTSNFHSSTSYSVNSFPEIMRETPTSTTFNPVSANAHARNVSDNRDSTITTILTASPNSMAIKSTHSTNWGVTDLCGIHQTLKAEF